MTLHIYDGLNVIRRALDKDPMGRGPRKLMVQMLHTPGVHVWAFEGTGSLRARRAILPGYKVRPSGMNDGFHAMVDLIREVFEFTPAIQVDVPGFEADDVIATIAQQFSGKDDILIHTTDQDLNALTILPGVSSTATPIPNVPADQVRLYKTYVGDRSDRIPGVRGFGKLTWEKLDKVKFFAAHLALLDGRHGPEDFIESGLQPAMANKIIENADDVRTYWKVVGFQPLPFSDVEKRLKPGTRNEQAADELLKRYHQ